MSSALSQKILQHHKVQHRVRDQPLELCVLLLKLLQAAGIRHVQPAIFGLQLVKARRTDAVLAANTAVGKSASCSFNIPIICSSANRERLIVRL